jgi:hypothetical protein
VLIDGEGQPRELRPSANGMVCLADAPGDSSFGVSCYPASFVPLIYRMEQLRVRGLQESVVDETIDAEVRTGKLKLPTDPIVTYNMTGPISAYDLRTNTVSNVIAVWHRLHVPYRTAAAIGLPTTDDGIHPYLMASGTYFAHVMLMERPLRH